MNKLPEKLRPLFPDCSLKEFQTTVDEIKQTTSDESFLDSCLLHAAHYGRLDIIKFIYENLDHCYEGPEECYPNCAGETPLLLAAHCGNFDIVKYLLEHNANPFAVDSHGDNAAFNAILSGNVELTKFLIEDCLIAWQGYTWEGMSALQCSLLSRNPRMFGYLLSLGALKYTMPKYGGEECADDYPLLRGLWDFNSKSPKWMKMLHGKFKKILENYQTNNCSEICAAAELGDLSKVRRLIYSYEYPLVPDQLVCAACRSANPDIFHYFINEMQFPLPEQALAHAVSGGNAQLAAELIYEYKQNIYQTTADGETLLHLALKPTQFSSRTSQYELHTIVVTDLLHWGQLDPNAVCYSGSVLDLACRRGDLWIVQALVRAGAKIDTDALCSAASCGYTDILEFLLETNTELSINAQGQNGTTALHEAIKGKSRAAVSWLLEKGAKIDINDNNGITAEDAAKIYKINLTKIKEKK